MFRRHRGTKANRHRGTKAQRKEGTKGAQGLRGAKVLINRDAKTRNQDYFCPGKTALIAARPFVARNIGETPNERPA